MIMQPFVKVKTCCPLGVLILFFLTVEARAGWVEDEKTPTAFSLFCSRVDTNRDGKHFPSKSPGVTEFKFEKKGKCGFKACVRWRVQEPEGVKAFSARVLRFSEWRVQGKRRFLFDGIAGSYDFSNLYISYFPDTLSLVWLDRFGSGLSKIETFNCAGIQNLEE